MCPPPHTLHLPAPPSPPSLFSLSFSFISRVHLHVWGKGVEMVGDDGARGAFPWPTESTIHKPHDQLVSLSKANRSDTHTHRHAQRHTDRQTRRLTFSTFTAPLNSRCRFFDRRKEEIHVHTPPWESSDKDAPSVLEWRCHTLIHKYVFRQIHRHSQGATTRTHTHSHKLTHSLLSHTHTQGSKQSLSLSLLLAQLLSLSPSLSLTPSHPHTHTTTVYQWVTSGEPEGSAEMNVKILTLVIVLLVSLLCSASAGEYRSGQSCRWSSPFALYFSLCVPWACAGSYSWSVTQHG